VEQLQQWIAEGRANGQTLARVDDGPWKPLSTFPEFAPALRAAPRGVPPRQPGWPSGVAGTRESAWQQLSGPAIGLIITGALGLISAVASLAFNILGAGLGASGMGGNPEIERLIRTFSGTLGMFMKVSGILISIFLLYGGLKMKKLENYTASLLASIIAMIPCLSPCCLIGLPVGIWALIVLNRPEVKSHFQ